MKITSVDGSEIKRFVVTDKGRKYNVTIWLRENGRFLDWDVLTAKGNIASFEVAEKIINTIEEKWDSL